MEGLVPFTIPIKGLHYGVHQFVFTLDQEFFQCFENSPVTDGQIQATLVFDKRPNLFVLDFSLEGTVPTECDRCLATINLPVSSEQQLLVKLSEEKAGEDVDADVVFIHPEATELNVGQFIYEYVVLAIPMIKTYACEAEENPPCNLETLDFLDQYEELSTEEEEENNPLWDELKKLDLDS